MFCLFLEEGGGGGGRNALPPNIMGALNKGRDGWDGSVSLGLTILWGWLLGNGAGVFCTCLSSSSSSDRSGYAFRRS